MPITIKHLGIDFGSSATTLVGIADNGFINALTHQKWDI